MKNHFYLVFAFMMLINCKDQKEEKLPFSENKNSILDKTFLGITMKGNKYNVIDKCDGGYPSLKISKETLYFYYPQEGAYHTIKNIYTTKNSEFKIITDGYYYFKGDLPIPENKKWTFLKKNDLIWELSALNDTRKILFSDSLNLINKKINYIKYPCDEDEQTEKKRIEKAYNYSGDGNWKVNCENGIANLSIEGKNAFLVVLFNEIYIDMVEIKRDDSEKGIAYKLKNIPEDLGSMGSNLNWKEYLNDKPIAYIEIIDDNTINFYWYGFYNKKTKKREFKDNSFYQETQMKDIILKKCN